MEEEKIVMALDLGTQSIKCLIGGLDKEEGKIEIKGRGLVNCEIGNCGIAEGVIKNLELTVKNIEKAVSSAEAHFGKEIEEVWIGFSGKHIEGVNENGSIVVSGRENEVDQDDVDRVIRQAKTNIEPLAESRKVIQEIPRWFKIDGEDMIKKPVGMSGIKLGVKIHLLIANYQQIRNIHKCVDKVGLKMQDSVPNLLSSAMAVKNDDASELGCLVIDMGAGTTDIAAYVDDALFYSDVLDIGGNIVTKDIAKVLRTPKNKAEKLKRKYGTTFIDDYVDAEEMFEVPSVGGRKPRPISREEFCEIIRPRMEEIANIIYSKLKKTNINFQRDLGAGIILTGGMANLHGFDKLLEQVFDLPVMIGKPFGIKGLDVNTSEYSSVVGILKYGMKNYNKNEFGGMFTNVPSFWKSIKKFIDNLFENK